MRLETGDVVRLTTGAGGMAAGSEGILLGWYARDVREALVNFYDGGPLRVPADAIEASRSERSRSGPAAGLPPLRS